ncbi:Protein phosphatase [Globisporangium polare]
MTLQYILARMRNCKPPLDGDSATGSGNQSTVGSCFASVGSAAHSYHGDDAVGYGPGYMVIADGVSGTMKASGVLARLLVSETLSALGKLRKRAREEPMKVADFTATIQGATKNARRATKRKGRLDSTLTVVYFDETLHQMYVYTIGDCKCVLMRSSKIVFESDSIIYDFNVPAVVSNNKAINYAGDVHIQTCKYEAGDVCMVFSDGVHDNLYVDQVVACIEPCPENAEEIAKKTVQMAKNTFTNCEDYIPFAVSAAGFCREAMEELKTNNNVNPEEYETFSQKCQNIPAFEITRPMFAKENRVRQLAFYSASNLLAFAHKRQGKRDDVSVCAAVLA